MWYGSDFGASGLGPLTGTFADREVFGEAQPMTVRLRGTMVREDLDWGPFGGNDLMIVTKFQIGDEPPVERLLFMEKDTEPGWHDDFFNDVVLSTGDFTGERLTLRLQVYDVDHIDREFVESVRRLSEQAAILFPQQALYAGLVNFAAGPLVELVNNVDDHDQILDERVTLEVAEPGTGHKLLQPGYFVCTREPVEADLRLGGESVRLRDAEGSAYEGGSYAVLELQREELGDRRFEIDQKAAKLLAELHGKGQSGQPSISFLRDTLDAYTKFRKLERARELQSRDDLTEDERRLLEELRSNEALNPYLGDG
jgi:hypothetical protein